VVPPCRMYALGPGAAPRLIFRRSRTRCRAQSSSDNASALRSHSTPVFSRSTTHPNGGQPGTPSPYLYLMTWRFRAVAPGLPIQDRGVILMAWNVASPAARGRR
jgi:hypothetical protein